MGARSMPSISAGSRYDPVLVISPETARRAIYQALDDLGRRHCQWVKGPSLEAVIVSCTGKSPSDVGEVETLLQQEKAVR